MLGRTLHLGNTPRSSTEQNLFVSETQRQAAHFRGKVGSSEQRRRRPKRQRKRTGLRIRPLAREASVGNREDSCLEGPTMLCTRPQNMSSTRRVEPSARGKASARSTTLCCALSKGMQRSCGKPQSSRRSEVQIRRCEQYSPAYAGNHTRLESELSKSL